MFITRVWRDEYIRVVQLSYYNTTMVAGARHRRRALGAIDLLTAIALVVFWVFLNRNYAYPPAISSVSTECDEGPHRTCRERMQMKIYPHLPVHVPAVAIAGSAFGSAHIFALDVSNKSNHVEKIVECLFFLTTVLFVYTAAYVCGECNSLVGGFAALLWWRAAATVKVLDILKDQSSNRSLPQTLSDKKNEDGPVVAVENNEPLNAPEELKRTAPPLEHCQKRLLYDALFCGASAMLLGWVAVENASVGNNAPRARVAWSFILLTFMLGRTILVLVLYQTPHGARRPNTKADREACLEYADAALRVLAAAAVAHSHHQNHK